MCSFIVNIGGLLLNCRSVVELQMSAHCCGMYIRHLSQFVCSRFMTHENLDWHWSEMEMRGFDRPPRLRQIHMRDPGRKDVVSLASRQYHLLLGLGEQPSDKLLSHTPSFAHRSLQSKFQEGYLEIFEEIASVIASRDALEFPSRRCSPQNN